MTNNPATVERPARTLRLIERVNELVMQRANCLQADNQEWYARSTDRLEQIAKDLLPSGSGIDCGTTIDLERSTADKIVLHTSFHHMNDGGMYDGWTEHQITVRPSFLGGLTLTISGRDRNDIKDYLYQTFEYVLNSVVIDTVDGTSWAPR